MSFKGEFLQVKLGEEQARVPLTWPSEAGSGEKVMEALVDAQLASTCEGLSLIRYRNALKQTRQHIAEALKRLASLPSPSHGPGMSEEEKVAVIAEVIASSSLIDAPKLPALQWHGLARAILTRLGQGWQPIDREPMKVALTVLCAARGGQSWSSNMLKDFDTAIYGLRAALEIPAAPSATE